MRLALVLGVCLLAACGQCAGYYDYAGAVHIHTVYSDGSGTFDDIAKAGSASGMDFLITSDHDTLKPLADGKEHYYGKLLVLVGAEISLPVGHYLALDLPRDFHWQGLGAQQCIDAINKAGGFGFLAHPISKWAWKDWAVTGYAGMEIVNEAALFDNPIEKRRPAMEMRVLRAYLKNPTSAAMLVSRGRPGALLDKWDKLLSAGGKVVGLGSTDAHSRIVIRGKVHRTPKYDVSFRTVQTHVLTDTPLTGILASDKERIYSALRAGRAYISLGLVGNPRGLSFTAKAGGNSATMGESISLGGGSADLSATTPALSGVDIRLLRNGREVAKSAGPSLVYKASDPGVYRCEIYRNYLGHHRAWVFTNPIYVGP